MRMGNVCFGDDFWSDAREMGVATKQWNGEDLMEYIKRFRDIALDCYDHCEERTLVEMCMTNMIREFRAVLENLEISQFA